MLRLYYFEHDAFGDTPFTDSLLKLINPELEDQALMENQIVRNAKRCYLEKLNKNQYEVNSKSKMSGGLFPGVLPTERREKAV